MFRFLFGVALGAVGAYYLRQRPQREELQSRMRDVQSRTSAVMAASRRILEETRNELSSAIEAGRTSVLQKADRLRTAAEHPERETGGTMPS
jgi:hypothetical protein